MIGRLMGTVVQEEADGTVLLDVQGVGYELLAPAGTVARARMQALADGRVTLSVHTHVREDAIVLFGFATDLDRKVFRTLLGVSSIGPRTAISVLSSLSGPELAKAVAAKDTSVLTGVPGVGKKTAERLILELRDKLGPLGLAEAAPSSPMVSSSAPASALADALTRMGFRPSEVDHALGQLGERVQTEPPAQVIRDALIILRR